MVNFSISGSKVISIGDKSIKDLDKAHSKAAKKLSHKFDREIKRDGKNEQKYIKLLLLGKHCLKSSIIYQSISTVLYLNIAAKVISFNMIIKCWQLS